MKKRKQMWEIILVSLAGLITIGLSINSIIKSNKQERELKTKQESLNVAQNKIIEGQASIIQLQDKHSKELKDKTDEVIGLQNKLQEKSDYIQNYLTGGSAYPYITIQVFPPDKFVFQMRNDFDFPVYDIEALIYDYDLIDSKTYQISGDDIKSIKISDLNKAKFFVGSKPVIPGHEYRTIDIHYPLKKGRYYIQIHTRKSVAITKLTMLILNNELFYGLQVVNKEGILLKEEMSRNVPQETKSEILRLLESIPNNLNLQLDQ